MEADWSIALGVLVYLIALIVAIVLYIKSKKLSTIAFIGSLATYVFAVFYTWDVFELSKNAVLMLLVVSTILMFGIGWYFKGTDKKKSKKNEKRKK